MRRDVPHKIFRCQCNKYKLWYQKYCYSCIKNEIEKIEKLDEGEKNE